jgi:hypothetical protein
MGRVVDLEAEYRLFKERVRDFQLVPVENGHRVEVKPHQLRLVSCSIPCFWVIVLDARCSSSEVSLYRVLVLTEDVRLAQFKDDVPVLLMRNVLLACLPFWIYLTDEFLREYSVYFTDLSEELVNSLVRWVERVELPDVCDVRGRYIMDVMELASWWNVSSMMDVVDVVGKVA